MNDAYCARIVADKTLPDRTSGIKRQTYSLPYPLESLINPVIIASHQDRAADTRKGVRRPSPGGFEKTAVTALNEEVGPSSHTVYGAPPMEGTEMVFARRESRIILWRMNHLPCF